MKPGAGSGFVAGRVKLQFKFNPALRRGELAVGDRRRWFFRSIALRIDQRAVPVWSFEIYWKRIVLGTLALAVAGYLTLVTALYVWLERNPRNQVGWWDLATAPVRWENLRKKRGDTAIETAFLKFEERDYVEGFYNLRVGLSRSQGNARGRVMLARLYAGSDPAQALQTLENGLRHSPNDLSLLRAVFAFYAQVQAPTRALEQSAALLAPDRDPPLIGEAREFVIITRAALLLERGDAAEAEALLASQSTYLNAADALRAYRLRVDALARLGRMPDAWKLSRPPGATDANSVPELRAEADIAVLRQDAQALESALRRLKAAAPDQPAQYIFAFVSWHKMKRLTLRDAAEQEYYRAFGGDDAAMQLFAATAVNLGLSEVVHRAMQTAQRNRLSTFAFRVHLTELALRRGDLDQAFRHLRDWERVIESLKPQQRAYPDFVSRLVRACVAGNEQQQTGLINHLSTMRGRAGPGVYALAAESLERAGHLDTAQQALALGLRLYPHTDSLNTASLRISERLAAAAAAAEKARPVAETVALPNTAADALQQIDAAIAEESYLAARELLRAIRTGKPAWLERAELDFALRDVELALLTQDRISSRAVVRNHLDRNRSDDEALKLVRLAEKMLARDRTAEARILHDEVASLRGGSPAVAFALRGLNLADDLAGVLADAPTALAAVDRELAQNRAADALRILDSIKQRAPAWQAQARTDLLVREVKVRLLLDQRPLAFAALRELVLRPGLPRAAAFKLVRDFIAEGEEDRALALAREIVKHLPGDAAARKLLAEAEAPRPTD